MIRQARDKVRVKLKDHPPAKGPGLSGLSAAKSETATVSPAEAEPAIDLAVLRPAVGGCTPMPVRGGRAALMPAVEKELTPAQTEPAK